MKRILLPLLLVLNCSGRAMDNNNVRYAGHAISCAEPIDGDDWMDGSLTIPTPGNNTLITIDGDDWVLLKEIESIPTIDIEDYLDLVWNYVSDVRKIRPIYDVRQAQRNSSAAPCAVIGLRKACQVPLMHIVLAQSCGTAPDQLVITPFAKLTNHIDIADEQDAE